MWYNLLLCSSANCGQVTKTHLRVGQCSAVGCSFPEKRGLRTLEQVQTGKLEEGVLSLDLHSVAPVVVVLHEARWSMKKMICKFVLSVHVISMLSTFICFSVP